VSLCPKLHKSVDIRLSYCENKKGAVFIARLSVRPSVRYVPVSDENGLTYRHSFITIR